MNKSRFLTIAVVALVCTNLFLAGSILFPRFRPHGPGQPREMVIRRLHFDAAQVKKYDALIRWHRSHIEASDRRIMGLKRRLYQTLTSPAPMTNAEKLMDSIGQLQVNIEHIHYQHFQDIRDLCRPDQLQDYDDVIREMTRIFHHQR